MSSRHFVFRTLAVASLLAAAAVLPLTARAQRQAAIPTATPEQIEAMGVRRGDYIIPYSSIPNPDDPSQCHTNNIIYSPRLETVAKMRYAATLLSYMVSPINASVGAALTRAQPAGTGDDGGAVIDPLPVTPFAGHGHGGTFSPTDLRTAYGVTGSGSNVIVIVDAYNYPNALSDFNTFSSYYGLPTQSTTNGQASNANTVFQVVYASGRPPAVTNSGWNGEAALDVQWAHAMAPNAKIVLVLGNTASDTDLSYGGVSKGNNFPNAKEVSMSFGHGDVSYETYLDANFQKSGIVYFASSGDTAGSVGWPSDSPYVVGVGGTSLAINLTTGAVTSETAWGMGSTGTTGGSGANGTGGGVSSVEPLPAYQAGIKYPASSGAAGTIALTNFRGAPDVAAVADPYTGVSIVLNGSFIDGEGGTSLSSPLMAGIVNAAGTFRASSTAELTYIYNVYTAGAYSTYFRDITQTGAGTFYAGIGYDLTTGVGSPKGPGAF